MPCFELPGKRRCECVRACMRFRSTMNFLCILCVSGFFLLCHLGGVAGPSVEGAAVWVPDSNANECMVCKKSKFSAINRRVRDFIGL